MKCGTKEVEEEEETVALTTKMVVEPQKSETV
jgi:hypothetical protein